MQTQRHVAVQEGCRREVDCYAAKQKGIQKCIAAIELDIAHAEATLLEAQVLRTNLEEYEVTSPHTSPRFAVCTKYLRTSIATCVQGRCPVHGLGYEVCGNKNCETATSERCSRCRCRLRLSLLSGSMQAALPVHDRL